MAAVKKEKIKDQMMHTAARIWEVEESEIEQTFDPLFLLMIEACANELEKIGQKISDSHNRLLDYLAEIMIPGSLFGAIPASGVIQATPIEAHMEIDPATVFSVTQKIFRQVSGNTESVDIHLSPICPFTLHHAELAYVFSGNKLFRLKENNSKELVFAPERMPDSNELWLAISPDKNLQSITGLSLFFDLRGHSGANSFYHALPHSTAWHNDAALELKPGFGAGLDEADQLEILVEGDNRTNKINRKAAFIYVNRFLQITGQIKADKTSHVPAAWKEKLTPELLAQLEAEKLIYIRIALSRYFPQEVLDAVSCSINAFPVVNKMKTGMTYRTDDWVNIIPLPSSGSFFDLARIRNEKNEDYKIRSTAGTDRLQAGEAIVRKSGIGKTSSQEVREMINTLTETIRDQSAFFGQISNEVITGRLREISKVLAGLEDNLSAALDEKPSHHYLMLRPKKNGELITIDYWVTNGEDANSIKAGTSVSTPGLTLLNPKKSFVLSNFTGGRDDVSETDKKAILRQQLISGNRIVSAQDVKLLCHRLYGNKIRQVDVRKSVQVSSNKEEGFKRSIDVSLTYSDSVNPSMKTELENLARELEYILQTQATLVYLVRVLFTNAD